jgi:hypothetical protein
MGMVVSLVTNPCHLSGNACGFHFLRVDVSIHLADFVEVQYCYNSYVHLGVCIHVYMHIGCAPGAQTIVNETQSQRDAAQGERPRVSYE